MLRNKLSFLPDKAVVWLAVYLMGVIYFALFRLLFLLTHLPLVDNTPLALLLHSFWVGFRFDSSILCIIILPLFLISLLPFVKFAQRRTRTIFVTGLSIIFGIIFFASSADIRFYDTFNSRLNYWAVEYIEYPGLMWYAASTAEGAWYLILLWFAATVSFMLLTKKLFKSFSWPGDYHGWKSKTVSYVLLAVIMTFGIRGRLGMTGLDWGLAFFSENEFVSQLSLNSVFTLTRSIYEELKDGKPLFGKEENRLSFYDNDVACMTVREMLDIKTDSAAAFCDLKQTIDSNDKYGFHPNVVIVIMESWGADKTGALGSTLGITPEFDKLCTHGILFTDFYANGVRTNRGITAILCSFPSLPGRSIMQRYAADNPFTSIAQILAPFGYESVFAYGGDIEFDNMRGFLKEVGYDKFFSESDFGSKNALGKWGVPDHVVFDSLINWIDSTKRPFNLTVMTLSNHEPYLIPDDRFMKYGEEHENSRMLNACYYSDWALGEFMNKLRQKPVFDSTIFIFTADHSQHHRTIHPLVPERFHIPLLFYAPALLGDSQTVIRRTASQVDIIPSLAGLLGIKTEIYSWGRDQFALNRNEPGFAVISDEEKTGLIEGSLYYLNWINRVKRLYYLTDEPYLRHNIRDSFPNIAGYMDLQLNSYMQMANLLSRGGGKQGAAPIK
ncbi:MAG: hypothetical protein CVT49_11660 [candidate division Zixibacteria bacterium HGW-Zixibacteria-1]|nr:MAG: hypothetical protein CVT49_11660 [candidate division Zixibacteria bacterium HGW-Zixibacteria-1]